MIYDDILFAETLRRLQTKIIHFDPYKIVDNKPSDLSSDHYLTPASRPSRHTNRKSYIPIRARLDVYKSWEDEP